MDIKGVNNNNQIHQAFGSVNRDNNVAKKATQPKISDKLDISDDAKKLTGDKVNVEKLNKIKNRIEIGFYDSDAIISKVAERILKEIN